MGQGQLKGPGEAGPLLSDRALRPGLRETGPAWGQVAGRARGQGTCDPHLLVPPLWP